VSRVKALICERLSSKVPSRSKTTSSKVTPGLCQ
jgi:hypothetical protein